MPGLRSLGAGLAEAERSLREGSQIDFYVSKFAHVDVRIRAKATSHILPLPIQFRCQFFGSEVEGGPCP